MPTQVAKKRFLPNVPVKAGTLYKVVVNNKDYIVRAKYNKTLSEFNAMWFTNEVPKQYFFNRARFNNFDGVLMPSDEIIVDGIKYKNEEIGTLDKSELEVLFDTYKEARLVSGLILTGDEDHRIHKIKIRPFRNSSSEELKYFQTDNWVRTPTVRIFKITKQQSVVFEVIEAFTPARGVSATTHSCIVNHTGFTVTFQGTLPATTAATTATYTIPNLLTSRKLTITPNGVNAIILKFE